MNSSEIIPDLEDTERLVIPDFRCPYCINGQRLIAYEYTPNCFCGKCEQCDAIIENPSKKSEWKYSFDEFTKDGIKKIRIYSDSKANALSLGRLIIRKTVARTFNYITEHI